MGSKHPEEQGKLLLNSVERILDRPDAIIAVVNEMKRKNPRHSIPREEVWVDAVASSIVSHYSNRSAISGGMTAIPGIIPGVGTVLAAVGGALADVVLMLKYEVEMAMALTHLYGFDIRESGERQLAFLLASVNTYRVKSSRKGDPDLGLVDLGLTTGTAIWKYTPREISKALLMVMTSLVLLSLPKGFFRAIPLVGVVVGGSVNKVLTTRVGQFCKDQLEIRKKEAAVSR